MVAAVVARMGGAFEGGERIGQQRRAGRPVDRDRVGPLVAERAEAVGELLLVARQDIDGIVRVGTTLRSCGRGARLNSTRGGERDTELNELTVMPSRSPESGRRHDRDAGREGAERVAEAPFVKLSADAACISNEYQIQKALSLS
ncbi:MAG: hypothetical protein M5U07_14850 [Xanthobacteraceae bacterium]|nr:hypothetical protein [Xanthobacteraceae bacterium]